MNMLGRWNLGRCWLACVCSAVVLGAGCGSDDSSGTSDEVSVEPTADALLQRAYVVSEMSDDLFVVDLKSMKQVGRIDTRVGGSGINENHMAVLSQDGAKLYITATAKDAIAVVDAKGLKVSKTIKVGPHNTHANTCFGCGPGKRDELWVVNEGGESPSRARREVVPELNAFQTAQTAPSGGRCSMRARSGERRSGRMSRALSGLARELQP